MAASFFFYDLETSGFDPRRARIMQFAGQRTDMDLKPIGEPVNVFIKLSADVLPDPDAVMITGITPQQTLSEGLSEAEFLKFFYDEVVKDDTIFLGFNSVRFDDEFMRFLHYRNFYDAYEWQWKGGCSRWDILDVVRMTRALRPDGINWPVTEEGKPTNRLELLTKANNLDHSKAHDALNDVQATIAVAKLIKEKQPDLFKYLLDCRHKKSVKELVLKGAPFVYTSGRYSSDYLHTTSAILLTPHEAQDAALVYDLRFDPRPFMDMDVKELVEAWKYKKDSDEPRLPVKTLKYNRCPAVAPIGVIKGGETQKRIDLTLETVAQNQSYLKQGQTDFSQKVLEAIRQLDNERAGQQSEKRDSSPPPVDERLYDGFLGKADAPAMDALRALAPAELGDFANKFSDGRLKALLPLYKARNYPKYLNQEERAAWDAHCYSKLLAGGANSQLAKYFARLQDLAAANPDSRHEYLLEELQLYGESLIPTEDPERLAKGGSELHTTIDQE